MVTAFARDPAKVKTKHPHLRLAQGNILDPAAVEAAVRGQDAVLSALGTPPPVWPVIIIAVACHLISRLAGLIWPYGPLFRWGTPLVAYFLLFRRTTVLSDGTRHIVQAMEGAGVKRCVCES